MTEPVPAMAMPPKVPIGVEPLSDRRCPWCSASLPADATDQCPTCHANLVPHADASLPGLTEVEPGAAAKTRRAEPVRRGKLLSWISGDVAADAETATERQASSDALELPSREVRREIWRLTLEAEGLAVSEDGEISMAGSGAAVPAQGTAAPEAAAPEAAAPDPTTSPAPNLTPAADDGAVESQSTS